MNRLAVSRGALPALLAACTASSSSSVLSPTDSTAIRGVQAAYVSAWLADDTTGVLATLDSAAVLLPPTHAPVIGANAIRGFWWPSDGSRTKITSFDWTMDEIAGTNQLAFTRGASTLAWTYDKDTVHQVSKSRNTNLTVLRRGADGRWRIARQMWSMSLP
jgi:ketosteroid isomerase-like protein